MDPKLSGLDPKLQDAYNRVMSGPTAQTTTTPPGAQTEAVTAPAGTTPAPAVGPSPMSVNPQPNTTLGYTGFDTSSSPAQSYSSAASYATPSVAPPSSMGSSTVSFNAGGSTSSQPQGTTAVKKKGSGLMPVLVGILIIFLLAGYTFVWFYIFGVELPFINF